MSDELYPPAFEATVERAMNHLSALTAAHESMWRFGSASWNVDQNAGTIVFETETQMIEAPVQIAGTYDTIQGTWLWGWDHPSVVPALAEHAKRAYTYGKENGIGVLTTRKLSCEEVTAWELTAVTCMLNKAQGAYRGPAGTTMVFFTFGKVTIHKK